MHVHDRDRGRINDRGHDAYDHAYAASFSFHAHVFSHARFYCAHDDALPLDDARDLCHRDCGHALRGYICDRDHGAHDYGCNYDDHGVLPLVE